MEADKKLLENVITGDKSWVFQYEPETKRQSRQWKSVSLPRPKKARMQHSLMKVMLITFLNHQEWCIMRLFLKGKQFTNTLQGSSDLSCQQNSSKTKSFLGRKNLDLASQQCSCPHSPQHETVFGLERNHHVASSTLFAILSPLRFLSFSKAERDSQGDTLPRS